MIIKEELLKSAELTGLWEKKLRQIEKGEYEAATFLNELKEMLTQIVYNVKCDNSQIQTRSTIENPKQEICPLCGKGHILKGKTAYGCSEWKSGCTYRRPFTN